MDAFFEELERPSEQLVEQRPSERESTRDMLRRVWISYGRYRQRQLQEEIERGPPVTWSLKSIRQILHQELQKEK